MYLIKTRDDDILNLETGDLYRLEKNLLPENCHVMKNDELAVSGGAACLRLWEHLLSLLKFDATKAQDAPRKFKTGDTVIITGTSNAANVGKRGTVTQVLDEIFNEVLLEGSTLRVFYEDKDLDPAD